MEPDKHCFRRCATWTWKESFAKQKHAPYVSDRDASTWFKILNPAHSQRKGREELFERDGAQ